jgi:hypothetical protein
MRWIYSHLDHRYSYESGYTSCPRSTNFLYGHVKSQIYINIYNTRISYSTATILLGLADVKACFQSPRIHADLTGAFGLIADKLYNLATTILFSSTASASSWEAFRRAIKALTKVFSNRPNLVIRHKKFIDMLKWEDIDPSAKPTPAFSCTINQGIKDNAGNQIVLPARIYVDNALMLALDIDHMKMIFATMIKAIFVVMGEPNMAVRQCPLAMDKWLQLVIGPKQTMLRLPSTPTDSPLPSLLNNYKKFLIYSTLGTLINVVSRCQKLRSLLEN